MTIIAGLRIAAAATCCVSDRIAQDPRVQAVYDVTGEYDELVMARVRDRSDLNDLTKTVFTLEGIERSFTRGVEHRQGRSRSDPMKGSRPSRRSSIVILGESTSIHPISPSMVRVSGVSERIRISASSPRRPHPGIPVPTSDVAEVAPVRSQSIRSSTGPGVSPWNRVRS